MSKRFRYILGVQSYANKESGAAIVRFSDDGAILDYVAISEERLIRRKHPYTFPLHSIAYCMDHFSLGDLSEIDLLVTDYIREKRWFNSGPAYRVGEFDYLKAKFDFDPRKIHIIGHHMAHAASAYYGSGFSDAAVLIVDGNGSDLETTSYFRGRENDIEFIENYKHYGIGAAYSAVTSQILNMGKGGEGKTMGLAPYGEPFEPVLDLRCAFDGIRHDLSAFMRRMPYSDVLAFVDEKFKIDPLNFEHPIASSKEEVTEPYFARVAFDIQQATETIMTHLARDLYAKTKVPNLCIAGGVGLNSVTNKIILDETDFERIHIFPASSDSGIPFGLAMWGYYNYGDFEDFDRKTFVFSNAYTGRKYDDGEIAETLERYNFPYAKTTMTDVAGLLASGKIIGWFQGGSEYGPRALGHRSILADSRNAEMRDLVNARVKHREHYRPFAPAVLAEKATEYFELDGESPYMLLVSKVHKPDDVPAVTHVDGTARVQTVTRAENGRFRELIEEFDKLTGVPVIMNTSFNDAGEPIVETPEDAILCFLKTEIDYLVLEDIILEKSDIEPEVLARGMEEDRTRHIENTEKALIEKMCPGYSVDERDNFVTEHNLMAEWTAKYAAKYELEKKVLAWSAAGARILVVGTRDHHDVIMRKINGFYLLDVVGYVEFDGGAALDGVEYDEILISSFEHQFEILHQLNRSGISKPVYCIYDGSSRDLAAILSGFPDYHSP